MTGRKCVKAIVLLLATTHLTSLADARVRGVSVGVGRLATGLGGAGLSGGLIGGTVSVGGARAAVSVGNVGSVGGIAGVVTQGRGASGLVGGLSGGIASGAGAVTGVGVRARSTSAALSTTTDTPAPRAASGFAADFAGGDHFFSGGYVEADGLAPPLAMGSSRLRSAAGKLVTASRRLDAVEDRTVRLHRESGVHVAGGTRPVRNALRQSRVSASRVASPAAVATLGARALDANAQTSISTGVPSAGVNVAALNGIAPTVDSPGAGSVLSAVQTPIASLSTSGSNAGASVGPVAVAAPLAGVKVGVLDSVSLTGTVGGGAGSGTGPSGPSGPSGGTAGGQSGRRGGHNLLIPIGSDASAAAGGGGGLAIGGFGTTVVYDDEKPADDPNAVCAKILTGKRHVAGKTWQRCRRLVANLHRLQKMADR